MADLLDNIHSELRARLQELRPLAAEYERLEAALAALASAPGSAAAKRSTPSPARSSAKTQARRQLPQRRAPRGRNKAVIFEAIRSAPEATVSDLQEATGIDKPIIYNVTRKAIEDGDLERVVLAGGIQGFKVTSVEKAAEPPKLARRRSRRKPPARATAEPSGADAQADEPSEPAA